MQACDPRNRHAISRLYCVQTQHTRLQTNMTKFDCAIIQTKLKKAHAFCFLLTSSRMIEHVHAPACSSMLYTTHTSAQTNMSIFECPIVQTKLNKARVSCFLLTCSSMFAHAPSMRQNARSMLDEHSPACSEHAQACSSATCCFVERPGSESWE